MPSDHQAQESGRWDNNILDLSRILSMNENISFSDTRAIVCIGVPHRNCLDNQLDDYRTWIDVNMLYHPEKSSYQCIKAGAAEAL